VLTSYKQRLHKTFTQTADLNDIDSTSEVIVSEVVENEQNVVIGLSHRKELKKGISNHRKLFIFFKKEILKA